MAAVMLRKLLEKKPSAATAAGATTWAQLTPEAQATVRDGLLAAFEGEARDSVRRKISHAVAEAAVYAAGPGCANWQALLPRVFSQAQAPDAAKRRAALVLFESLASYAGEEVLVPHAATLLTLLPPLLQDADNGVRIAAMAGTIALLRCIEDDAVRGRFTALVPTMMKVGVAGPRSRLRGATGGSTSSPSWK